MITDTGANTGFDYAIDTSGASLTDSVWNLKDDAVTADLDGSVGSLDSGAFIRVKVGGSNKKIQLYDDS